MIEFMAFVQMATKSKKLTILQACNTIPCDQYQLMVLKALLRWNMDEKRVTSCPKIFLH